MAVNCVFPSKKQAESLGITEGQLRNILQEYTNSPELQSQFTEEEFIDSKLNGLPVIGVSDAQMQAWEEVYSTPREFDTIEDYNEAASTAEAIFGKNAIGHRETPEGKHILSVANPYTESMVGENNDVAMFTFSKSSGETITKGKLGVNKEQLITLLGSTMYQSGRQEVAVKELMQNAFDAVKIAKSQGKIERGTINVVIDTKNRTVKVSDNGTGMTPEIVQKAFFTIGGSYKGDNVDSRLKSGGLGLAKMAFLFRCYYSKRRCKNARQSNSRRDTE